VQVEVGSAYCLVVFALRPNSTSTAYFLIGFGHLCSLSTSILIDFVFLNFHFDYLELPRFEIGLELLQVASVEYRQLSTCFLISSYYFLFSGLTCLMNQLAVADSGPSMLSHSLLNQR
jgi:hypothetical protein